MAKQLGVTEQTTSQWRRECGGMDVLQARERSNLDEENRRQQKQVADLSPGNASLKEVL